MEEQVIRLLEQRQFSQLRELLKEMEPFDIAAMLEEMPEEYKWLLAAGEKTDRVVCDFIAGMSDQYAVDRYETLFIPKCWQF